MSDVVEYHHTHTVFFPERAVALHVMPTSCGRELVTSRSYRWDGMLRGDRELVIWQYTVSGEGGLDIGDETMRVRGGEGMLLIVPEEHVYYLPRESESWEFTWISFCGSEAVRLARECRRRHGPVLRLGAHSRLPELENIFFDKCERNELTEPFQASVLGYEFILQLVSEYGTGEGMGERLRFMRRINDYCMSHLDLPVTVDELAERAGYSRWHFSRMFKEYNGIAPLQYVLEQKMRMAMQLLQNSVFSVKEIGMRCGYEDPGYFCKVFRRVYNVSPGEFRNGARRKKCAK